jgi:hypothetical protein
MLDDVHHVGAHLAQPRGLRGHARRAGEQRVHLAAARLVGELARRADGLQPGLADVAAARLRVCEHVRHVC